MWLARACLRACGQAPLRANGGRAGSGRRRVRQLAEVRGATETPHRGQGRKVRSRAPSGDQALSGKIKPSTTPSGGAHSKTSKTMGPRTGHQAHGSIGHLPGGNAGWGQRTRQGSKTLRSNGNAKALAHRGHAQRAQPVGREWFRKEAR